MDDGARLQAVGALMDLQRSLAAFPTPNATLRAATADLQAFLDRGITGDGTALTVAQMHAEYTKWRDRYFEFADWCKTDERTSAVSAAAATATTSVDAGTLRAYDLALENLRLTVARAQLAFSAMPAFEEGASAQEVTAAWRAWISGWRQEVDGLNPQLPPYVAGAPLPLVQVRRSLDGALWKARGLAAASRWGGPGGAPNRSEREARIDELSRAIESCAAQVDSLRQR
jgi:hypothetical protein